MKTIHNRWYQFPEPKARLMAERGFPIKQIANGKWRVLCHPRDFPHAVEPEDILAVQPVDRAQEEWTAFDFVFRCHGSVTTVTAETQAAKDFARDNFPVEAWMGGPERFTTDWRAAKNLMQRLEAEGWTTVET